jgi:hypothetical protein
MAEMPCSFVRCVKRTSPDRKYQLGVDGQAVATKIDEFVGEHRPRHPDRDDVQCDQWKPGRVRWREKGWHARVRRCPMKAPESDVAVTEKHHDGRLVTSGMHLFEALPEECRIRCPEG